MPGESKVIKIMPGVAVPPEVYGVKNAGHSQLLELQSQSPVPYRVPDAWAVPPLSLGNFSSTHIRQAFNDLTRGLSHVAVLMARSSATNEKPGEGPSPFSLYDPRDVDGSFARYAASVTEVLETSRTMGVQLTQMVGDPVTLEDDRVVIGRNSVSFVADSHHPFVPDDMSLSLVHGLGTKVVTVGGEAIVVTVDRATGLITHVGEQAESAILLNGGSNGVRNLGDYRQQTCAAFDVSTGKIINLPINGDVFAKIPGDFPNVVGGQLVDGNFTQPSKSLQGERMYREMRYSPFGNVGMYAQLTGALKYLSGVVGDVQAEGAFLSNDSRVLDLYQLLKVPALAKSNIPLTIQDPDLVATQVIGYGKMRVPLLRLSKMDIDGMIIGGRDPISTRIRAFDAKHATTGYAVLAPRHERGVILATPNCRVRLSEKLQNPSSHPVTWTRFAIEKNPNAGYVLAMSVKPPESGGQTIAYGAHDLVDIESNGRELRLKLNPPSPIVVSSSTPPPKSAIIKIAPGVAIPQDIYGVKNAGHAKLIELQPQSPVPYLVPEAWAVPPLAHGGFSDADIRTAFNDLSNGLTQAVVLMARSSATDEMPGKNPTLFTYYDPQDVEGSFTRYLKSVKEVLGASRTMGVQLTKMVGEASTLPDGRVVIGRRNVSFVADSHNPVAPEEMSLSLVHGLGTKVVEAGNEVIIFIVGKDGDITYVGEQNERAVLTRLNSTGITELSDYKQRTCDAFDVRTGKIKSAPIGLDVFGGAGTGAEVPNVVHGVLMEGAYPPPKPQWIEGLFYRSFVYSPFGNVEMYHQLTGAMEYLAERIGPSQAEGAFTSSDASVMYLYQCLSVPLPTISNVPLTIQQPDLISTSVLGAGRVQMPLFHKSGYTSDNDLRAFDAKHAATGYAVFAWEHDLDLTTMTPGCRVRLSESFENMSSHPVTWTRFKMHEDPSAGYMMAMRVKRPEKGAQTVKYGPHDTVLIESNGKELRLELPPLPEEILIMRAREMATATAKGSFQELKGTGVTLVASVMAQVADAWIHNDWRGVQQTSVTSLALDGAAIFGTGAAAEVMNHVLLTKIPEKFLSAPTRTLGVSGLKLGAASAFLQLLHNDHVSFAEVALNVGSGVAYQVMVGRMIGALDSLGLKATARFFAKTPGTILLSATFMFGMQQLHRQKIASEIDPALQQARAAVTELIHAEAKIREAQRTGVAVAPEAIATVQRMMNDYVQQLKKLPDVDEVMLYREHIQELAAIRESAQEASMAAMATPDPTSAMDQIDHTETVEIQRENRKFAERLASLHEKLIQNGRILPSLEDATEFLPAPRVADLDNGDEPSYAIDELLSHSFSGMAAQLEDYLKASI